MREYTREFWVLEILKTEPVVEISRLGLLFVFEIVGVFRVEGLEVVILVKGMVILLFDIFPSDINL